MFTPQEVSEKVFPKASFGGGGYNMASVDEFLDALTEDYTALFKENVTLKAKLKVLAEKVEEYRSTEEAMRKAIEDHNEISRIITEIGDLRKAANPVITGYEFHVIQLVSQVCPHDLILPYLKETLAEIKKRTLSAPVL